MGFNPINIVLNLFTSNFSIFGFNLYKLVGIFKNLSISNLSTFDFRLTKLTFFAKDYLSIPFVFWHQVLLHNYKDLIWLLHYEVICMT